MARMLRALGLFGLAAAACVLLAGEMSWIPSEVADSLVRNAALAGAACLLAGILMGVLSPVGRVLRQGRCARCGTPIEPGQTYCHDHLQATVNEYRDQTRAGLH